MCVRGLGEEDEDARSGEEAVEVASDTVRGVATLAKTWGGSGEVASRRRTKTWRGGNEAAVRQGRFGEGRRRQGALGGVRQRVGKIS